MTYQTAKINSKKESGLTLLEVAVAIALFAVIAMGIFHTTILSMQYRGDAWRRGLALNAVQELLADIQNTANTNLSGVYDTYNGQTFTYTSNAYSQIEGLQISVECWRNEVKVPASLGGIKDLNMEGSPIDMDLPGSDLAIIPMRLTVTWTGQPAPNLYYHLAGRTATN